jgi:hypothetical protein
MINMKEMYVVYDREVIDSIEDVECECVVETEADAQEMSAVSNVPEVQTLAQSPDEEGEG